MLHKAMFVSLRLNKVAALLAILLAPLLLCPPSWSQGNLGRILGVVTDQSGAAVAGATVTVRDVQRGVTRTLTTDSGGEYSAPDLIPGQYEVSVEAMGFAKFDRQNIDLQVGREVRVDAALSVGVQTQTVTVTEEAPNVTTTNATLGGMVESHDLTELPLSGRNFLHLLMDSPGVEMKPGGGPDSYVSNGQRSSANAYLVEGLFSTNVNTGASPIVGAGSGGGGPEQANLLPLDAIQEISVMEDPKAEFGGEAGAYINIGLKSGTNDIHGTAYAFGRDSGLEARNAFLSTKQVDSLEQWGASVGGPIKKDKLFYFGNFERQHYSIQPPKTIQVPTTDDLGTGSIGLTNSFPDAIANMNALGVAVSPLSLNLAGCTNPASHPTSGALIPCTASSGVFGNSAGSTAEVVAFPVIATSNNFVTRVDYTLNDHNTMHGEYVYGDGKPLDGGATVEAFWQGPYHIRSQVGRAVWVWSPNSTWVNETEFGTDRILQDNASEECSPGYTSPNYASLGFVSGTSVCGFPALTIGTFTALGSTLGSNNLSVFYQGQDAVSHTVGKHILKFGGGIRNINWTGSTPSSQIGAINFAATTAPGTAVPLTALQAFLAGIPNSGTTFNTLLVGNTNEEFSWKSYWSFIQDDWRLTQRITVNLGLRYDFEAPMRSATNSAGGFDPTTPTGLFQQTNSVSLWNPSKKDFGPRLGVAWDVTGRGKTVVRLGGGVFYQPFITQEVSTQSAVYAVPTGGIYYLANGTTIQGPGNLNNGTISGLGSVIQSNWALNTPIFGNLATNTTLKCGDGIAPNPNPCSLTVNSQALTPGVVGEWNLGIQQAITNGLTLDVNYVGNHGANEMGELYPNQPTPGVKTTETVAGVTYLGEQQRRPYYSQFPYLGSISEENPRSYSNYNGLQVNVTKRVSRGLSFHAGYTYAHALDMESESHYGVMNTLEPSWDYGNSDYDYRHRFTITGTYLVPGKKSPLQMLDGWQLNSSFNVSTGQPFNMVDSTDDLSGTGVNDDRWDLVGTPKDFTGGSASTLPCYGITGSKFAGAANCTAVTIPAGAVTAAQKVANMPQACVNAAASLPVNPNVPSTDPNATGLAALSTFGCYMEGNSVIVPPAQGTYGDISRNEFYGPVYRQWDFSVVKNWKIKERITAQFRAEMFNLLNFVNYGTPGISAGTNTNPSNPAAFGVSPGTPDVANNAPVFGTGGPRRIQLGLKFIF